MVSQCDRQQRTLEYLQRMDDSRSYILLGEGLAGWRWTRGYAADMANSITLAVIDEGAAGRVYNVGEPETLSTEAWVRAIAQAAGWQGEVVVIPDKALPAGSRTGMDTRQDLVTDSSRIRDELGYAELISREEALRRRSPWSSLTRRHHRALDHLPPSR